jgi:membrane protein DedA with SNARE-associated domain
VVFNAAVATLWVGVWTTVGYLSGTRLDTVYGVLRRVSLYVLAVLVVAVLLRIAVHLRRRRRPSSPEDAHPDADRRNGRGPGQFPDQGV